MQQAHGGGGRGVVVVVPAVCGAPARRCCRVVVLCLLLDPAAAMGRQHMAVDAVTHGAVASPQACCQHLMCPCRSHWSAPAAA